MNVLTTGLATPIIAILGFLLRGSGTLLIQKWIAGDPLWKAVLKALAAGIAVGALWPLALGVVVFEGEWVVRNLFEC